MDLATAIANRMSVCAARDHMGYHAPPGLTLREAPRFGCSVSADNLRHRTFATTGGEA